MSFFETLDENGDIAIDVTYSITDSGAGDIAFRGVMITAVPEPATMSLLALGGLAMLRRRRRA